MVMTDLSFPLSRHFSHQHNCCENEKVRSAVEEGKRIEEVASLFRCEWNEHVNDRLLLFFNENGTECDKEVRLNYGIVSM